MDQIASDAVLEEACAWLRAARADAHPNDDVWHLLHWWSVQKSGIQQELRAGAYRFEALRRVQGREQVFELWSARDALVLKATSLVLTRYLAPNLSRRCFHLAGTGGLKGAIREVQRRLPDHTFVFRTDVKGYYASINHELLFEQVRRLVPDRRVLNLVWQYMERWVRNGGNYTAVHCGIALGCPLSPLMGALYLKPLDDKMAALGLLLCPIHGRLGGDVPQAMETAGSHPRGERGHGCLAGRATPRQDLHRPDFPRIRLPGVPFFRTRSGPGSPDRREMRRTDFPALRARCGRPPHRGIPEAVGEMGEEWVGWPNRSNEAALCGKQNG